MSKKYVILITSSIALFSIAISKSCSVYKHRAHAALPEEIRAYDFDKDGSLSGKEISALLTNYCLEKKVESKY